MLIEKDEAQNLIKHPIPPLFDENSKILILGSFPSVKSRECGFFYGHPQNRFWKVMAFIFNEEVPKTIEEKSSMLLRNKVALWDVIASCDITGSSDSSIKNVVPNDVKSIINSSNVQKIFVNGRKAKSLYDKFLEKEIGMSAVCLPSTSPANASWNLERLENEWKRLLNT